MGAARPGQVGDQVPGGLVRQVGRIGGGHDQAPDAIWSPPAQLRLGVASNNVANASTPGFKQDQLPAEVGKAIDLMRYVVDQQGQPVGTVIHEKSHTLK